MTSTIRRAARLDPRKRFKRVPRHIGFIPDGNRRWARSRGLPAQAGYAAGIEPGLGMLAACRELGVHEVSIYGFTKENVRRPSDQVVSFRDACVSFALRAIESGASLLAVGDSDSQLFPTELLRFVRERSPGDLRVNLLVNYGWQWDLEAVHRGATPTAFETSTIPRVDLVVRWGGRRRLLGFLPLQCAYSDFCVIEALWPDASRGDLVSALDWYQTQDVTMGG